MLALISLLYGYIWGATWLFAALLMCSAVALTTMNGKVFMSNGATSLLNNSLCTSAENRSSHNTVRQNNCTDSLCHAIRRGAVCGILSEVRHT